VSYVFALLFVLYFVILFLLSLFPPKLEWTVEKSKSGRKHDLYLKEFKAKFQPVSLRSIGKGRLTIFMIDGLAKQQPWTKTIGLTAKAPSGLTLSFAPKF